MLILYYIMTNIITGIAYTKYNTGIILGTFGSWVACNAPFILTPCLSLIS